MQNAAELYYTSLAKQQMPKTCEEAVPGPLTQTSPVFLFLANLQI